MHPPLKHVLIIEDDLEISSLLQLHLRDHHMEVASATTGPSGLEMALNGKYDLVILDLMLPGLDGMEVCKRIRSQSNTLPIMMLTARSEEIDKVLGLELGADDYLTKPFSIREFLARTKALLRRSELSIQPDFRSDEILRYDLLEIDLNLKKATLAATVLDLTAKEWELLALFAQNPGRTYSRLELLDLVWGYHYDGYSHTVNSHINRLRGKIETDPVNPKYVLPKRGLGYRFAEPKQVD